MSHLYRIILSLGIVVIFGCSRETKNCQIRDYIKTGASFGVHTISYEVLDSAIDLSFADSLEDKEWFVNFKAKDSITGEFSYFKPRIYKYNNGSIRITDEAFGRFKNNLKIEEFFLWSNESWYISNCQIARFKFVMGAKPNTLIELENPHYKDMYLFDFQSFRTNAQCNPEDAEELLEMIRKELSCKKG